MRAWWDKFKKSKFAVVIVAIAGFVYKVCFNILKQLYSTITDHNWDVDVFRLGGIAAYIMAGELSMKLINQVSSITDTKFVTAVGLVSVVSGMGTALFSQSRKHDDTLAGKP
jgi:hypothetical protein